MDPAERLARQENARQRWIAGEDIRVIAQAVGINPSTVSVWSWRCKWPTRPRHLNPNTRRTPDKVALGHKLWTVDKLPRLDIANLLGIAINTLAEWRRDYGWPKRKVGRCALPEWERVYRRKKHDKVGKGRMKAVRGLRTLQRAKILKRVPNIRWVCCEKIRNKVRACPDCGRPHPLLASE